jgi:hypothetical protein
MNAGNGFAADQVASVLYVLEADIALTLHSAF